MEVLYTTGPNLQSILTLASTILFGIVAIVGWLLARRKKFPAHCRLVAAAALLNWIPVLLVMISPWVRVVMGGSDFIVGGDVLVVIAHGLLGLVAQLLMTYTVVRMYWLKSLPPRRPRWLMVLSLLVWVLAVLGGINIFRMLYIG